MLNYIRFPYDDDDTLLHDTATNHFNVSLREQDQRKKNRFSLLLPPHMENWYMIECKNRFQNSIHNAFL